MSEFNSPPGISGAHSRKLSDGMRPLQTLEASVMSPSVKDQDVEVQRLQKNNFNMKLRIFYLEERLAQRSGTDDHHALEEELFQQKLLNDERSKELEDRNLLLIKSRNAIESLQTDLELVKAQCHTLQDSSVDVEQLENKTRLLELQDSKIQSLQQETDKHAEGQANAIRENGALRAEIARCEEQRQQKETEVRALRVELEDQARQVSRLTTELEVARPQLSLQDQMGKALDGKENELDALGLQLDESKARERGLESELRTVKKREEENGLKASEIARLEADEIARLHGELETVRRECVQHQEKALKLDEKLTEKHHLLVDTNKALSLLQQKIGTSEGELTVMKESVRMHDEAMNAEHDKRTTELRRDHQVQLSTVRQQLIEQGNRLTQSEFARDEAQRRLVAETDELSRSRRLCSEMQKRVLEADEARRSDEQSRTLLLDQQIRARETLEHELRSANSELESLRIERVRYNQNIAQQATDRERHITQEAREFIDLVDTQLTECLKPAASNHVLLSSSDDTPATVMLRRAMARLDVNEGAATAASSGAAASSGTASASLFPQRSVLHKLYKLQKMKHAFEHVVHDAETKYIERVRAMENSLVLKNQQLDRVLQKQQHLTNSVTQLNALRDTVKEQHQYQAHAGEEIKTLEHTLSSYKKKCDMNEMELTTQKKMNEELALQLSKAGSMVEALKDAQQALHMKMSKKEQEQQMYTNELKNKHDTAVAALALARSAAAPASSLRASIQQQVRRTQQTIENGGGGTMEGGGGGGTTTLEQERSRYLSASDLNVSGTEGSSRARKVRIHRSGSVDIRFDSEQMAAMVAAGITGTDQQQPPPHHRDPKLVQLHDQLHGKQEGLEHLLRNIRSLVGSTEKFLDRFFKFKGGTSSITPQRSPLGSSSRHFGASQQQQQQHQPNSPTVSVLQRDVMTLLDSNARLALQLQALGKDLQTVYRRFKALEISLIQQEQQQGGNQANHGSNTHRSTQRHADVGPIVEQMQKWGRDLQSAASQLSTSQLNQSQIRV